MFLLMTSADDAKTTKIMNKELRIRMFGILLKL